MEDNKQALEDLNEILNEMQTKLTVKKDRENKFSKYYYRSAEDILQEVKKLFPNKFIHLQTETKIIPPFNEGSEAYIEVRVSLCYLGSKITSNGFAREPLSTKGNNSAQTTGLTFSYAYKYALCSLFAISSGEDMDSSDNSKDKKVYASEQDLVALQVQFNKLNLTKEDMLKIQRNLQITAVKIGEVTTYKIDDYHKIIKDLESKKYIFCSEKQMKRLFAIQNSIGISESKRQEIKEVLNIKDSVNGRYLLTDHDNLLKAFESLNKKGE